MIRPSFRDPAGCTWVGPDVVHRAAWEDSPGTLEAQEALDSLLRQFQAEGKWITAKPIDPSTLPAYLQGECPLPKRAWEHPRVFFPSYAHEWSPGMVHCAAGLTLELNQRLLIIGWELKDAAPSNILFEGANPVFVDHLSPTPRKPGQMGWVAYGQFVRTFLIPLILHRLNRLPLSWLYLARRDGLPPEDALTQLSMFNRLRPSIFGLITLPAILSRRWPTATSHGLQTWKSNDAPMGLTITKRLLRGLYKRLHSCTPPSPSATVWSEYDQTGESYSPEGLQAKEAFVIDSLDTCHPKTLLDLGSNTGRYSLIASRRGSRVVAVDSDVTCVDRLWKQASASRLDVQPLVVDLGRTSPSLGWENGEETAFLQRTQESFDMVIALAIVHHLMVRERIPIQSIVDQIARTTNRWALIEWVPPEDPMFIRLAGSNMSLYAKNQTAVFEESIERHFRMIRCFHHSSSKRIIYLVEKNEHTPIFH